MDPIKVEAACRLLGFSDEDKAEALTVAQECDVNDLETAIGKTIPLGLKLVWFLAEHFEYAVICCDGAIVMQEEGYMLCSFNESEDASPEDETVREACSRIGQQWPSIVPIGSTASGDSICLNYGPTASPAVVVRCVARDYEGSCPFVYLARDFSEFLDRCINSYESSDVEMTAEQIEEITGFPGDLSVEIRDRR